MLVDFVVSEYRRNAWSLLVDLIVKSTLPTGRVSACCQLGCPASLRCSRNEDKDARVGFPSCLGVAAASADGVVIRAYHMADERTTSPPHLNYISSQPSGLASLFFRASNIPGVHSCHKEPHRGVLYSRSTYVRESSFQRYRI